MSISQKLTSYQTQMWGPQVPQDGKLYESSSVIFSLT